MIAQFWASHHHLTGRHCSHSIQFLVLIQAHCSIITNARDCLQQTTSLKMSR